MAETGPLVTLVGGYGLVGAGIARRLLESGAASVRIAGQSEAKARRLADALGCASALVDLDRPETWPAALDRAHLVVACIDRKDPEFVRAVLSAGVLYADITASDGFFKQVESLDSLARHHATAAILSIGFAPGLSNLLVKHGAGRLDEARSARIGVLLGLGDAHGRAAIAWVLDNLPAPGSQRSARTEIVFRAGARAQPAYRFDFADQHVVRRTLGLAAAETSLAFDSGLLTRLVFRLAPHLHGRAKVRAFVESLLPHLRLGSDRCALSVEVEGRRGGEAVTACARFEGRREADVTARFAAVLIGQLLRRRPAPGVFHSEQIADAAKMFDALRADGGVFHFEERAAADIPFTRRRRGGAGRRSG